MNMQQPCDHVFIKYAPVYQPLPSRWTCQKCGWDMTDADYIAMRLENLHNKVDAILKALVKP